jgi:hypothetical protein
MEYKGIQYLIVQTANPTGFKWTVLLEGNRSKSGEAPTMKAAVFDVERKISKELKKARAK